jgi:hypothetical protein
MEAVGRLVGVQVFVVGVQVLSGVGVQVLVGVQNWGARSWWVSRVGGRTAGQGREQGLGL